MADQSDDDTGPAGKVVPVEDIAAEIVRMFDEAAAKANAEPVEPTSPLLAAIDQWQEALEANARLFPYEHRAIFPGPDSGRA